jgi:non-canonical (house-cleaning) NTP pyrophosphatase
MFHILIGSTRPAKVDAARTAAAAIAAVDERFLSAEITPIDAGNVGPAMPMTERETIEGARLRALSIINRAVNNTNETTCLAIGVEGGLDPLACERDRYALKSWAAATDGTTVGYGSGGSILVPDHVMRAVLAGRELGDVIDAFVGSSVRGTRGAWGVLTRDLVGRRESFTTAIIAALAPFYNGIVYHS